MASGHACVAGVDEVGRGPLAGPVTAAAVVLDPEHIPEGLNDSKKLTARKREALHDLLLDVAEVSVAHASVEEIDALNILRAAHLAMVRA
ncbi:MAG: ribonuclease HII, partial [Pseudomonadota bacterium]